MIQTTTA